MKREGSSQDMTGTATPHEQQRQLCSFTAPTQSILHSPGTRILIRPGSVDSPESQASWRERLCKEFPLPYTSTRHPDNSGVNAAITLLRIMAIFYPTDGYLHSDDPLIQYACIGHALGSSQEIEHPKARRHLRSALNKVSGDLSFYNLTERDGMRQYLWEREEYLFFTGLDVQVVDAESNRYHVSGASTRARARSQGVRKTALLAAESLLHWDGSGTLDETIISKYLKSPSGVLRFCNFPHCVRVLYTPKNNNCPNFQDLMRTPLSLRNECGHLTKMLSAGSPIFRGEPIAAIQYCLHVVVRLRTDDQAKDHARVYWATGEPLEEARRSQCSTQSDEVWQLGQHGSSYMLYYMRT